MNISKNRYLFIKYKRERNQGFTLQRRRRSMGAFLVLVMSKGPALDSWSSSSEWAERLLPASTSFGRRYGDPLFMLLITLCVAGEMAPSISISHSYQYYFSSNIQQKYQTFFSFPAPASLIYRFNQLFLCFYNSDKDKTERVEQGFFFFNNILPIKYYFSSNLAWFI